MTKYRHTFLLLSLATIFILSACGGGAGTEPPAIPPTKVPEPTSAPPTEAPPTEAPQTEDLMDTDESVIEIDVDIVDSTYADKTTTVPVGTTVTWTHEGQYPHTVTFDAGSFDSGSMGGGDVVSFTFDQPGTYAYYCTFHGGPGGKGMSGTIIVTE